MSFKKWGRGMTFKKVFFFFGKGMMGNFTDEYINFKNEDT